MKKIHIKAVVNSQTDGESITDTIGEYNEEENIITYIDNFVSVRVIIGKKITIERFNDDYKIFLVFEEGKMNSSIYEIFSPKMNLEIDVNTMTLRKEQRVFYIEYELSINKENTGKFTINFEWEEQNEY